jgi:hypothetical protein
MTDDEKRRQKAMLLLEHQEAENDLAHLREKAGRLALRIKDVGEWLTDASPDHQHFSDDAARRNANIRTNIALYRGALNFDDALAAMDEIVRAEELVRTLGRRKSDLGLK